MKPETSWQTGLWTQSVFQTPPKNLAPKYSELFYIYIYVYSFTCVLCCHICSHLCFFFLSYPVSCCFYTSASQRQFSTLADDKDVFSSILRDRTQTQCVSLSCVSLTKLLSVITWLFFFFCPFYTEFVDRDQNRKVLSFRQDILLAAIMTWLAESSSLVVLCCILLTKFLLRAIMQDPKNTQS